MLEFSSFMEIHLKIQLLETMETEDTFNSTPDYVDLVNLVRSIQRAEGNIDCYRRGRQQCDRRDCAWRNHCLKVSEEKSPYDIGSQEKIEASDLKQKEGGSH